jgi:hypothetical protein
MMRRAWFLFPFYVRYVGLGFIFIGIIIGIIRFYFGQKPDILDMKIFAFYSSYLESKYLEIIRNNMSEEFTGFFILSGLFLIAFAKEKKEDEHTNSIRLRAFIYSFYLNFVFLLGALLFTFGFAFVYMLMINMGMGLLLYILVFRILVFLCPPEKQVGTLINSK